VGQSRLSFHLKILN